MAWAREHGVEVPTTNARPYSIDDNLWGRAIECGVLENPWNEPPDDIYTMTADPLTAPDEPEFAEISFKPVSYTHLTMGSVYPNPRRTAEPVLKPAPSRHNRRRVVARGARHGNRRPAAAGARARRDQRSARPASVSRAATSFARGSR